MTISKLFYSMAFAVLLGWLLAVGQTVIVPVVISVMLAYVLVGGTEALARLPVLGALPLGILYAVAIILFGGAITVIALLAFDNLRNLAQSAPVYQETALALIGQVTALFGMQDEPSWEAVREMTLDRLDLAAISLNIVRSVVSIGGYSVLIATYVLFLVAERGLLTRKLDLVFPDTEDRGTARALFRRINRQITTYLSVKTLVNAILGVLSYAIMWVIGVENAVFWAFLIGIFNYIPYVGSLIGVGTVAFFMLIETGGWAIAFLTLVTLAAAQIYVGNWLEPRLMSRSFNLSPFVVLVALVVWSSLWGIVGAIIAVPMTSILVIVLAAFDETRAIAVLLSRAGDVQSADHRDPAPHVASGQQDAAAEPIRTVR